MDETEPSKFKIRPDDNPEAEFHHDNHRLQVEKLSRRLTFITVLIPCLIGLILFFVYRDIQRSVGQVSNTGTTNVRSLSKDLEIKFSELSEKQEKVKEEFSKKISALDTTIDELQKTLKEATTAIRYIRSARISDNKKISDAINAANNTLTTLATLPKDIEKIVGEFKAANQRLSEELESYTVSLEGAKNNLIKVQADMISLSSAKVDTKDFDLALKNLQENYQKRLRQTSQNIESKIAALERKMEGSGAGKPTSAPSPKATGSSPTPPASSASKPEPAKKMTHETDLSTSAPGKMPHKESAPPKSAPAEAAKDKTTLPKPGTFIEQDIK